MQGSTVLEKRDNFRSNKYIEILYRTHFRYTLLE